MKYAIDLPPGMPNRMKGLDRDDVGRPVPFFVAYVDGQPDFRVMDSAKLVRCVKEELCWVCGQRLLRGPFGPKGTFAAGPMCLVNRNSAEPPSHDDCAWWSTVACPFLTRPKKVRRESNLPDGYAEPAGVMIARNPGVTALIECHQWSWFPHLNGLLFRMGPPTSVTWMAEGREASAEEVLMSIDSGLPELEEMAAQEAGGIPALAAMLRRSMRWVPGSVGTRPSIKNFPAISRILTGALT